MIVTRHEAPLEFGHSVFNALAVRCVPEGQLESRPAIYRRYWCLEIDLVPEGRSKLAWPWLIHSLLLVFTLFLAPKNRQPLLVGEIKERFRAFVGGIAKQNEMKPLCIGGVADHVHLLLPYRLLCRSLKRCS
jgi:Transposase IS200 like